MGVNTSSVENKSSRLSIEELKEHLIARYIRENINFNDAFIKEILTKYLKSFFISISKNDAIEFLDNKKSFCLKISEPPQDTETVDLNQDVTYEYNKIVDPESWGIRRTTTTKSKGLWNVINGELILFGDFVTTFTETRQEWPGVDHNVAPIKQTTTIMDKIMKINILDNIWQFEMVSKFNFKQNKYDKFISNDHKKYNKLGRVRYYKWKKEQMSTQNDSN